MSWQDLARDIVALGAPVLGRALAGPAGALAGDILAEALGVPATPAAVRTAIAGDPASVTAALGVADATHADEVWRAHARAIEAVNATMRQEALGDSIQRWWRPFVGYVFGVVALLFGLAVVFEIAMGRYDVVPKTAELIWFFGVMAAVVGVSAAGRTVEKLKRRDIPR